METNRRNHSTVISLQGVVATMCIVLLCIVYLAGYVQWQHLVGTLSRPVSAARLHPRPLSRLAYAPDVILPPVSDGKAPALYRVPTSLPVVFLTIDDGYFPEPEAAAKMNEAQIPASLFLTQRYVSRTPSYFEDLAKRTGSVIEDHTLTHKDLVKLTYNDQRTEVCVTADIYGQLYGKRPTLFRPPYGDYNDDTLRAAGSCGLRAVVLWTALVEDGAMQYQRGSKLRAGDIVLMHFTPNFKSDLQAFIDAARAAGLTPQLLEDWFVN